MSEENKKENNDSSREKINEELDKVKNEEKRKETGGLDAVIRGARSAVCCYSTCPPPLPLRIWQAIFGKDNSKIKIEICPDCHVELLADPEEKYDFRCPKCGKGFNHSDLTN